MKRNLFNRGKLEQANIKGLQITGYITILTMREMHVDYLAINDQDFVFLDRFTNSVNCRDCDE